MPTHPLLARARSLGNPVIEGDSATLVWQGTSAPRVIDDLHNWDEAPQKMLRAGAALWYLSISLPADAYLEYAFIDSRTCERIPDPLNPNQIRKGAGVYNHYFYMPQGKPSPLVLPTKGIEQGTVTRHSVPTLDLAVGAQRTVYLYHPPVKKSVPLLIVYDGVDYLRQAKLNVIVDNLIAEKRIRPFAMALVQNSRTARSVEYSCAEFDAGSADGMRPACGQGKPQPGTDQERRVWNNGRFPGGFDGAVYCSTLAESIPEGIKPIRSVHCTRLPVRCCGSRSPFPDS